MKQFAGYLTIFGLFFSPVAFAHDGCDGPNCPHPEDDAIEAYYMDEEDDEFFNQGKIVGKDTGDYLKAQKRIRNKNWALALGTSAIGIATLVLLGKNQ